MTTRPAPDTITTKNSAGEWICGCGDHHSLAEDRCLGCLGWRSPSHQIRQRLLSAVRGFIEEHEIGSEETVYQSDRVSLASPEFICALGKIVGWVEWDDETDSSLGVPLLPDEAWPHLDGSEAAAMETQ